MRTSRAGFAPAESVVQELTTFYDASGNISRIRDDAQQTIYFRNRRVEPSTDFLHDATYRLIEAVGREHLGQAGTQLGTPAAMAAPRNTKGISLVKMAPEACIQARDEAGALR